VELASRQSGNTAGEGGRERRGSDMSFYFFLKRKGEREKKNICGWLNSILDHRPATIDSPAP